MQIHAKTNLDIYSHFLSFRLITVPFKKQPISSANVIIACGGSRQLPELAMNAVCFKIMIEFGVNCYLLLQLVNV